MAVWTERDEVVECVLPTFRPVLDVCNVEGGFSADRTAVVGLYKHLAFNWFRYRGSFGGQSLRQYLSSERYSPRSAQAARGARAL
jgi:hypothetical protein